jgi:hypothetical protein
MILEVDWVQTSQGRLSHENVHHQSLDHKNSPFQGKMKCLNLPIISNTIHKMLKLGNIIVPLPFWHKLNYLVFCRTFEKIFFICAEILMK